MSAISRSLVASRRRWVASSCCEAAGPLERRASTSRRARKPLAAISSARARSSSASATRCSCSAICVLICSCSASLLDRRIFACSSSTCSRASADSALARAARRFRCQPLGDHIADVSAAISAARLRTARRSPAATMSPSLTMMLCSEPAARTRGADHALVGNQQSGDCRLAGVGRLIRKNSGRKNHGHARERPSVLTESGVARMTSPSRRRVAWRTASRRNSSAIWFLRPSQSRHASRLSSTQRRSGWAGRSEVRSRSRDRLRRRGEPQVSTIGKASCRASSTFRSRSDAAR